MPFKRREILVCSIIRRASVVLSGGSAEGAVLEELDELAAHPEQEHRPELRIDRRAEDQLVAGPVHHRLDRHALEVLGAPSSVTDARIDS